MSVQKTDPATTQDPLVRQLREQISDTDRAIVALMNRRLELVRDVQQRKADLGLPLLDRAGSSGC